MRSACTRVCRPGLQLLQPGFEWFAADAADQQRFRGEEEEQQLGCGVVVSEGPQGRQIAPIDALVAFHPFKAGRWRRAAYGVGSEQRAARRRSQLGQMTHAWERCSASAWPKPRLIFRH